MKNKKILYILIILIIILGIIGIIIFLQIKNGKKIEYSGDYEQEPRDIVTRSDAAEEIIKKYLFRFWNLCLTEDTEGIKALCSNYTKQIPKSINSFSIDQIYTTNGLSTYFVKTSLNMERYYYTILEEPNRFTIIEITRDEFEKYKKEYNGEYKNYIIADNTYNSKTISNDIEASFYINIFISNLKNNIDRAYKQLKPEYAIKRFGSVDNFKKYVEDNKQTLLNIRVNNSSVFHDEANNKKYVFYDRYSNVYITEIDQNNDFNIQLDDYTLDNDIFNATYENCSSMDKALLNCEKFLKMLNTKDYKAAYNILDETFKQTNFKTQADFENYIKTKTFNYNKAKYEEYKNPIDNIHAFKMILTDATGASKEQKEFNIVMRLKEEREFVMSFEVKE